MEIKPAWYTKQLEELHWNRQVGMLGKIPPLHEGYSFEIGEEIQFGGFVKAYILESFEGGKYYKIEVHTSDRNGTHKNIRAIEWNRINKLESFNNEQLFDLPDIQVHYSNRIMEELLMYNNKEFGIDFNHSYQRDLVWSEEDKLYLLDSIFHGIDIGKFTFVNLGYDGNCAKEILDGKQRLTTIFDFYDSKIKYKGKYFHELHPSDKRKFCNYSVVTGELPEGTTLKQKLQIFKNINTSGRVMDKNHLDKIDKMIKEIK